MIRKDCEPLAICNQTKCNEEKKEAISMTEEEMLQRLEQSGESSKKGNYRNADDVISDMRGKYGL
jgi:hypothetical protein